jgi:hypothetical protein
MHVWDVDNGAERAVHIALRRRDVNGDNARFSFNIYLPSLIVPASSLVQACPPAFFSPPLSGGKIA